MLGAAKDRRCPPANLRLIRLKIFVRAASIARARSTECRKNAPLAPRYLRIGRDMSAPRVDSGEQAQLKTGTRDNAEPPTERQLRAN